MASPNVFQALIPQQRSVIEYAGDLDRQDLVRSELQQRQRQNALQDMAAQQQIQRQNALQRAASGWGVGTTDEQRIQSLRSSPLTFDAADSLEKSVLERSKTKSTVAKDQAEAEAKQIANKKALLEHGILSLQTAAGPQDAARQIQAGVQQGFWSMQDAQAKLAAIPQDPAQFEQWRVNQLRAVTEAYRQLPTVSTVDLGGKKVTQAVDPFTGRPTVTGTQTVTQSPDNAATVGASLANAAALREQAKATRDAANAQRDQATEMKLADDYRSQSKEFQQAKSAHEQLTATLGNATTSPAATLAAATKFMKILDPGSVVRESELGMALAASGVIDRALNYVSTLQSGQKLTPTQAADFKKISNDMYGAAQRVQQTIDADYKAKAKAYNLRPEMVTQDLGQNAKVTSWAELK